MKVYKTAIIGTGFIGKVHLETVRRLGNVEVVAVVDKVGAKETAEAANVPHYFDDYRELFASLDVDMVHICTPNFTHYEIAMAAIAHGVNVLCEKPMTMTIEEAERMVGAAEAAGLVNAVNYHNRFYPMTNHLMNIIRNGELGDVFALTGSYCQDWMLLPTDFSWRLIAKQSGKTRAVSDIGTHWMDLAEFVSGQRITAVCADFQRIFETRKKPAGRVTAFSGETFDDEELTDLIVDTEDSASLLLRFSGGAKGCVFISQVIAGKAVDIELLVGGYKASAEWRSEDANSLNIGIRDESTRHVEKGLQTVHPSTRPLIAYPFGHAEGFADAFKQCFREVYDAIDHPENEHHFATFRDGLHEMVLCDAIFESNNEQRWVEVPEPVPTGFPLESGSAGAQ